MGPKRKRSAALGTASPLHIYIYISRFSNCNKNVAVWDLWSSSGIRILYWHHRRLTASIGSPEAVSCLPIPEMYSFSRFSVTNPPLTMEASPRSPLAVITPCHNFHSTVQIGGMSFWHAQSTFWRHPLKIPTVLQLESPYGYVPPPPRLSQLQDSCFSSHSPGSHRHNRCGVHFSLVKVLMWWTYYNRLLID